MQPNNPERELLTPDLALLQWAQSKPDQCYLRQRASRRFVDYTFAQVAREAQCFVTVLQSLGLEPGDRVALVSKNCAEWFIVDLAIMMGGFISVPIFPTANEETINYCVEHSEAKVIIAGKLDDNSATQAVVHQHPDIVSIALPYSSAPICQKHFRDLLEAAEPYQGLPTHQADDLMSIVYTSGTSGTPKGALLTYGAFVWSVEKLTGVIEATGEDRLFSYLPLAHITERVYIFGTSIMTGACTAFPESLDTFVDDLQAHQPTLFISVPRLWTLFKQRIEEKLPPTKLAVLLAIPFVNRLIKKKIAQGLGLASTRLLGCGSAPVSPALLLWFDRLDLPICEAWGMTETFAYSTLNLPYRRDKVGSVGQAGPGVDIRIAKDDEILVRSKGIFAGYYLQPEATADTFTGEWLHTGDIGYLDDEGYLFIQGRKKDTFKTAKGKFVAPVPIEKKLADTVRADMLCLIGLGLPAPILLVVSPDISSFDPERYQKSLTDHLQQFNQTLASHEKIKGVLVVESPWSIENGVLTPTLKIKRHVLEQRYHELGQQWPADKIVLWEKDLA